MNIVEDLINIFYEKQFFKNHQKILNYTKQLYILPTIEINVLC